MKSTLEAEWMDFFSRLNEAEQESLLRILRGIIERKRTSNETIDISEYNREIDQALEELKIGNYITQEEMQKRAASW